MAQNVNSNRLVEKLFPTRALLLLLGIGALDLVVTAWMHAHGMIVELNPLMKPLIERSEWLFVFVKGATLGVGWFFLSQYAKDHKDFVRNACLAGSFFYVAIWTVWFVRG